MADDNAVDPLGIFPALNTGGTQENAMANVMASQPPAATPTLAAPKKRGFLKDLLLNMAQGAAIAGGYASGIPQSQELQAQTAETNARVPLIKAQTKMMTDTVDTPFGPMNQATWKSVAPAIIRQQTAQRSDETKKQIANINAALKGLGLGYELSVGDDGNITKTPIAKEDLSPVMQAKTGSATPSMARWVATMNDPNAKPEEKQIAERNIKLLSGLQIQQQEARGKSFAYNRGLYQWQTVTDPRTGQIVPMQGWQISQLANEGTPVIASGKLGAKDQLAVQQLSSEAEPAIGLVRDNLKAYDNDSDRKIFARLIHDAGTPRYGQESGWMGNILNQALSSGLSPEGQALVRNLSRLNETVGRFRTIMGAPSTDTQMALAIAMLPGPSTPNSKYAEEQLKNFEDMVKLGVNVPMLRGAQAHAGGGTAKPSGRRVIDLTK